MKEFLKKKKYLIITILLTIIIICSIFAIKNIYPFGGEIFTLYNIDDEVIPLFYKLWDILHNNANIFFSWNYELGSNIYSLMMNNGMLTPINLLIAFFKKSYIPYAISFIVILKIIVTSIITYYSLKKLFPKIKESYITIFSLLYTFSGTTLFLISRPEYLTSLAIFPLIILFYQKMINEKKVFPFVIIMLISTIMNYYTTYMILIFLIVLTFLYQIVKPSKKNLLRSLISILLSIGLSLPFIISPLRTVITSFSYNNQTASPYFGELALKFAFLLPLAIPILFNIKLLKKEENKKNKIFILSLFILFLLGLFVPKINKIWQMNYVSEFPFIYSFIISFFSILGTLYYLGNRKERENQKVYFFISLALIVFILFISFLVKKEYINSYYLYIIVTLKEILGIIVLFILSIIAMNVIDKNGPKTFIISLGLLVLSNIFIYSNFFIKNLHYNTPKSNQTFEMFNKLNIPKDNYNVVVNTPNINFNYSLITDIPSISVNTIFRKPDEIEFAKNIGLKGSTTLTMPFGSNAFFNLLMNNKYYISETEMPKSLYKLIDQKDNFYLYESIYNLGNIIPYSGTIENDSSNIIIDNTNLIYKNVFNEKKDILKKGQIKYLEPNKIYYIYTYNGYPRAIKETIYQNPKNYLHAFDSYDRYILEIIVDKKTPVDLSIYDDLKVAYIDINDLKKFTEKYTIENSVKIKGNTKIYNANILNDTNVLIPINYNKNYEIKVNNKKTGYKKNIYNMVSLKLKKGKNKIEIKYKEPFLKISIIISIISLLITIIFTLYNKKLSLDNQTNV